jgi:imidazolonepropionase-like amidohydrolase
LAIVNVHVVDLEHGSVDSNRTVLIDGGRIAGIVQSGREPAGFKQVREVAGTFVIPGLWDMHVHLGLSSRSTIPLYVANGITGVRDMGGSFPLVRGWADSVASGLLMGPEILASGPVIERTGWLNAVMKYAVENGDQGLALDLQERIGIATPGDAIAAVDSTVALGADFVKIRNDPSAPTTLALLRRARERHIRVVGHWPERLTPVTASDSGYASLEHGALTVVNGALTPTLDRMTPMERQAFIASMVRNRTAHTPTLVAIKGFRLTPDSTIARILADTAGVDDPRVRYVPRPLLTSWRDQFAETVIETSKPDWAAFYRSFLRDIRPMVDAGVLVLAGTDVGSALVFPAFSLADELEALVSDAGLSPLESLRTATANVGRWLGDPASIGGVTAGARADLVFLTGNPLADIRNVRNIRTVLRNGNLLNRAMLDQMLANSLPR